MAHQRHEPARGVRRIGGRAVVDLGPQPRPALDGQRRAAAAPVAEDQPQRRADQHPHHPGLHRDGAFVALHLHEGRERRLLPAERPHDRTVPDHVYDDVRRRHPPALHAARPAARLPRSGRQCRHVGRRRHRLPRRHAVPFGPARIAFRPLPQRFRIAPSAVTRSVTSRSRPSSSSTSYQSPSGVSTKSAPSIPNAA